MNKEEVQQRVLKDGKPLDETKFMWDETTNTFSSKENGLVIDFGGISYCTFTTGYSCTFTTGDGCTFTTWYGCTFTTGYGCTFTTGYGCTFTTWSGCTFTTWSYCTFTTGSGCTFTTGSGCTFTTGNGCTFTTGDGCTFTTGDGCTFTTGYSCVVVRKDIFEVIQLLEKENSIKLCPYKIKGYIKDGVYSETGKTAIIADNILSEIVSKKEKDGVVIYSVINYSETEKSYLLEIDGVYSHGKTIKEANESYKYKISNKDTSQFKALTLESVLTDMEAIKLYRTITGACESGTRYFVENLPKAPKKLTVTELIEITKGQFNHEQLVKFFDRKEN